MLIHGCIRRATLRKSKRYIPPAAHSIRGMNLNKGAPPRDQRFEKLSNYESRAPILLPRILATINVHSAISFFPPSYLTLGAKKKMVFVEPQEHSSVRILRSFRDIPPDFFSHLFSTSPFYLLSFRFFLFLSLSLPRPLSLSLSLSLSLVLSALFSRRF